MSDGTNATAADLRDDSASGSSSNGVDDASTFDEANAGWIEEMLDAWKKDPTAVPESWRRYFETGEIAHEDHPDEPARSAPASEELAAAPSTVVAQTVVAEPVAAEPVAAEPVAAEPVAAEPVAAEPVGAQPVVAAAPTIAPPAPTRVIPCPPVFDGDTTTTLRGASARIVDNMEASLTVPTATSVRVVPAKLLEVNRLILNNNLERRRRGKVSFTHLIAYAVTRALRDHPVMNAGYTETDGQPTVVRHQHVNIGLAVDLTKPDGSRTLVVPSIKQADTLDFAALHAAYEELIKKARNNRLTADDMAGTTVSITNPGTIGTVHSVPRLMPGQGVIVGVGAIDYPAEFQGADPAMMAKLGVGKTVAITSTYDHRIIQGAESGEFLARVHELLIGADGFYDDIFQSLGVPYEPARWVRDHNPLDDVRGAIDKQLRVLQLVNMYRVRGHLIADLDPLALREPHTHHEVDPTFWGLSIWDLDREFLTSGIGGKEVMTGRDILGVMRDAYARTMTVEYMHIQEAEQKLWIQSRVERRPTDLTRDEKLRILERLGAAESFERFLHTKYRSHKRFSLEGAESLIPMLDALLSAAADRETTDIVIGMAHRGRLNVLTNVIGKSHGQVFREFEGELDPESTQGSGDVKYHLGATGKHDSPAGNTASLRLAANPSHLEAVGPVVEGMARALCDRIARESHTEEPHEDEAEHEQFESHHVPVLAVLVHGDAAFAGQGVVAETFNLSALPGYQVGGTVHIIVNNQVGFTTSPEEARSSEYATDVAKMVQAPIFHVNGDDPEACVRAVRLALDFRQTFAKDVVVDMWCYRRHGHNEGDEPSFTQPRMYAVIDAHPSVRNLYRDNLVDRGQITAEDAEEAAAEFQRKLEDAFDASHATELVVPDSQAIASDVTSSPVGTAVDRETVDRIIDALTTTPEDFTVHPKLARQIEARRQQVERDQIDWALAEHLAVGSMLLEGHSVRMAGQDTRRGTFSQRHASLVDYQTEHEYLPLSALATNRTQYSIYDSLLSEYAALGFEYGYSVIDEQGFVAWEAQFGDFVNGAQIILDQFLVAAEDKWGQRSALCLLLPHGFEGQGPEHSSARIERFVSLCAEDNIRVVAPTTAAQYFHVLRRQVHAPIRRPLVVFTPKRYLRMPEVASPVAAFTSGAFEEVLDDDVPDPNAIRRVLLTSGKFGHELIARRRKLDAPAAVVRLEQLYPLRTERIREVLDRYPNAEQLVWVQEEPENMGAWNWIDRHLFLAVRGDRELTVVARSESSSPASGSATLHEREQEELLSAAFADLTPTSAG